MKVVGLDPAFKNFGMVAADLEYLTKSSSWFCSCPSMELIKTVKMSGKKTDVRVSSDVLRRAQELHYGLHNFLGKHKPQLVFVEVPSGAQSAAAGSALGVAIGVLGSIEIPVIEVTPLEVKKLFTRTRESVPKSAIMEWAYDCWPEASWLKHNGKRTLDNEHLADALAVIRAGVGTTTFKQLLAMRGLNEIPMSHHDGHPPRRQPFGGVPVGAVSLDQRANQTVRRKVLKDAW